VVKVLKKLRGDGIEQRGWSAQRDFTDSWKKKKLETSEMGGKKYG